MSGKRTIKPRFWLIMISVCIGLFICLYVSQEQYINKQQTRIEELIEEYNQKKSQNQQIERKIAFSKTDEYVERVAHDELGLLKKGEIRFVAANEAQDHIDE